jgi:hypothetical protein
MNRLTQEAEVKATPTLQERIEPDEGDIDSIRFIFPRPMVVERVELAGDNSEVNLLVLMTWRLVIPSLPIFYFEGKFMPLLDADVAAGIVDFCATHQVQVDENGNYNPEGKSKSPLTYQLWLRMPKDKGSPFHRHLIGLNADRDFREDLERAGKKELVQHLDTLLKDTAKEEIPEGLRQKIPLGLVAKYGLVLVDIDILAWEPDKNTKELANAVQAKELAKRKADGVREEALGVRDAKIAHATGEAARFQQLVGALIQNGVDPNTAAEVIRTQLRTENIRDSKIVTYVEGGASSSVMIPASSPPPAPPASSP